MLKIEESGYSFEDKNLSLKISGGYDSTVRGKCTLDELETLIVQLQKLRMIMVMDQDGVVEKKLIQNLKAPDNEIRSILMEEEAEPA